MRLPSRVSRLAWLLLVFVLLPLGVLLGSAPGARADCRDPATPAERQRCRERGGGAAPASTETEVAPPSPTPQSPPVPATTEQAATPAPPPCGGGDQGAGRGPCTPPCGPDAAGGGKPCATTTPQPPVAPPTPPPAATPPRCPPERIAELSARADDFADKTEALQARRRVLENSVLQRLSALRDAEDEALKEQSDAVDRLDELKGRLANLEAAYQQGQLGRLDVPLFAEIVQTRGQVAQQQAIVDAANRKAEIATARRGEYEDVVFRRVQDLGDLALRRGDSVDVHLGRARDALAQQDCRTAVLELNEAAFRLSDLFDIIDKIEQIVATGPQ